MKLEIINIQAIKPYENNPRKNERAVEKIAESIRLFGFKNPVILDKNNVIVYGHTRQSRRLGAIFTTGRYSLCI